MRAESLKLPFAFDPRSGASKRWARQRRVLVALGVVLLGVLAAGLTLALRSQGGGPLPGGPLTGPLATARYSDGFSLRYPSTWTRVNWSCTGPHSITSPIGLLTNARPAPTCPGPSIQGWLSFPPRERLGPNTVSVSLANGGLLPGEKLQWNSRIGGKPAFAAPREYGRNITLSGVSCPAGVPSEFRRINIAAALGLVEATVCGPNLAAGNAAVDRLLASIQFKR